MIKTIYSLFFLFTLLSNVSSQVACNTWLLTNANGSYASLGDLDVTGNQLTVEALVNRTSDNIANTQGHVISKHSNASNANYNLSIYGAEITTSVTGYVQAFENCQARLNKTYHIAMVYDGASLKFYRDGFLHSSTPCTGNLVNNNLIARIAQIADLGNAIFANTQFMGFVNEVRIWNVARTITEINQYKFSTLPTPNSQIGLLAYYSFDNLLNKQGNSSFNATLFGGATNNSNNSSCTYVSDSCCSKSLYTANSGDFASIGDLDLIGSQLTVEAVARRTEPQINPLSFGHLVSKHTNTTNCNYNLSSYGAEITTSISGYVQAFASCPTEVNKTYHVAMVYDGASLKFYRNGILLANTPCTGTLINNNLNARIAQISDLGTNYPLNTQFIGYIDEVKIWNIARSREEINMFINTVLPNPTSQQGLVAYYNFNDLLNKQGNSTYNLSLVNNATINTINPNCRVANDSCGLLLSFSYNNFSVNPVSSSSYQIGFSTLNENGFAYFNVESSIDGTYFKAVNKVLPNNKEGIKNYASVFLDEKKSKELYFRICFVKNDGKKIYSNVIKVNTDNSKDNFLVNVFPNPTSQSNISFSLKTEKQEKILVELISITGKTLYQNNTVVSKGFNSLKVEPTCKLSEGTYLLSLVIDNKRIVKKIHIRNGIH
jgi:hypothetical protein